MPHLRGPVHKAPVLEEVLQPKMQVDRVVKAQSSRERRRDMKRLPERPTLPVFSFGNPTSCVYCGDPAWTRDHVIAVSFQRTHRKHCFKTNGPWCWACKDCNIHLHNKFFDSFLSRCEWASWRISVKAKPIEWHEYELKPLDFGLRAYIKNDIAKRRWIQNRADFYGSREFYLNLENLIWECTQMNKTSIGGKYLYAYFSSMLREVANLYK